MYLRYIFILLLALNAINSINAQCFINIETPGSDTTICQGDSVFLQSDGSCNILMINNFDNASIGSGWSSTQANPVFNNPCGSGPNSWHLWVGTTPSYSRTLVTNPYDVSSGNCVIKWWMRYGRVPGAGNCEDPDYYDEGVHLQYSTNNGASWTDFPGPNTEPTGNTSPAPPFTTVNPGSGGYWQPHSYYSAQLASELYYWNRYENPVPNLASTSNTRFRWAQLATSSTGYDAWGIDEVEIYCPSQQNVHWSHGPQSLSGGWVKPTFSTSYVVTVFDSLNSSASDTININVTPSPNPVVSNDTTICDNPGNFATFAVDSVYSAYQWSNGGTSNSIQVNTPGQYVVTVFDGNCSNSDTATLAVTSEPYVDAGADTTICLGDSITLSALSTNGFYAWNNGDSSQSTTVTPSANTDYILTAGSANTCLSYDTISVEVFAVSDPNISNDTTICGNPGNVATFVVDSSFDTYLWSNGGTSNTITVSNPGVYKVKVTKNGCARTDSVNLSVNPAPIANLGSDTAICMGDSIILTSAPFNGSFLWNTGDTSASITVSPANSQQYIITAFSAPNCTTSDTLNVTVNPIPDPDLGNDTTICGNPGNAAILKTKNNYTNYLWSNGATTDSIIVNTPGAYSVSISQLGCTGSDSINVFVNNPPIADAGPDKTICQGDSIPLSAANYNGFFYWSTGDSSQSITVAPLKDTTITLKVIDSSFLCYNYDTILITVNTLPNVDAGKDQEICEGDQITLTATGANAYLWTNGSNNASISVNPLSDATYTVTGTDQHGCSDTDSTKVRVNQNPVIEAFASESSICLGDEIELTASGGLQYLWDHGVSGSYIIEKPTETTYYNVTGENIHGCKNDCTLMVEVENCSRVFIPSAFSPNRDGINDYFAPVADYNDMLEDYEFIIYDRFGNIVFQTNDPSQRWDGTSNGNNAQLGVYAYRLKFKVFDRDAFVKTGTVTIVK